MDAKFLEFWGNYLLSLSRVGKLQEESFRFLDGLLGDPKKLAAPANQPGLFEKHWDLFRKCYGLEKEAESPDYMESLRKASEDFQRSLKEFMTIFDVVPRSDYEEMKKKCGELEERIKTQEETMRQLRGEKMLELSGDAGFASGFQEMIRTQTEQFTAIMDSLGKICEQGVAANRPAINSKEKTGGVK